MDDVLKYWGLAGSTVSPISNQHHISTWDISNQYILKKNHSIDEFMRSYQISSLLSTEGISVPKYIPANDGRMIVEDGLYSLMTKLQGNRVDLYEKPDIAYGLGMELARLHSALAHIQSQISSCYDNDLIDEWKNYIKPGLYGGISNEKVEIVEARFYELYPKLPRQLIHRDAHVDNILFTNGQVSGWLDFDISHRDVRLFDLVYLLSCFQPKEVTLIGVWRLICNDIISGYNEVQPLSIDERAALPVLMIVNGLLFVSFWGCQNKPDKRNQAISDVERIYSEWNP
ncbi:MAG: phosphotransferase [Defluviitaleaceae bacterium]|nr:phosphotransferase [Defluviitaleaceae bacterium]